MLEITALGGLVIRENGTTRLDFAFRKEEALLVYLAFTQREHSREVLADLLWDERSQVQAMSNLRVILHGLRQRVGPYLLITRQTIGFNPDQAYRFDVAELETGLRNGNGLRTPAGKLNKEAIAHQEQALALFRGEFLEGFSVRDSMGIEDWIVSERERIHNKVVEALHQLVKAYIEDGAYSLAIAKARWLLEIDPIHEQTHRHLMTLLVETGQRNAALTQYDTCKRKLAEDLAVEPDDETTALYEAIRIGKVSAVLAATTHFHNLPPPLTAFIGRSEELAQIASALMTPSCRLLTLVGPGGVGKTRLALQAAADAVSSFKHGVYHVPLITISASELLISTIAEALDFTFYSQRDPGSQLVNYLRDKQMLLVLDDFTHLLDGTALLSTVLAQAPGVKMLVTSLERLNLQEEWTNHILGMQVPTASLTEPADSYDAIQLFIQTARRSKPDFRISKDNQAAVIRVCQLVEGMPLGVELAAAWTRIIPCDQIAEKVAQDLNFLTTSARNIPERHRSLRVVFENSWRLLSAFEQTVFMRLSVFQGSFGLEAAEMVAGASFPVLTALIDKSMVRTAPSGRFNLHELLKQFAHEKLFESGELIQAHQNHLEYFALLAERLASRSGSSDHAAQLDHFELELDNWRAALDWGHDNVERAETGLRLAGALWRFWQMAGYVAEGLNYLDRIPLQTMTAISGPVRVRALAGTAMLAATHGDLAKAEALSTEALAALQANDDPECKAIALNVLGTVARSFGNYLEADRFYRDSLACSREAKDNWLVGLSLSNQGLVAFYQRDFERSARLLEEALTNYQRMQNNFETAFVLNLLGRVAQHQDNFAKAQKLCRMALELCWERGNKWGVVIGLSTLAGVYTAQGKPERAVRLLGAEDALREAIHSVLPPGIRTGHAGNLNALRAQLDAITFATAWSEGLSMTSQQAVAYALNGTGGQEPA